MTTQNTKPKDRPLTGKQAKFVEFYVINGNNATKAARDAGYKGDEKTLAVVGFQNIRKYKLVDAIKAKTAQIATEGHITREEVIKGLKSEAKGLSAANRIRALELLGKAIGTFVDVRKDMDDDRPVLSPAERVAMQKIAKSLQDGEPTEQPRKAKAG